MKKCVKALVSVLLFFAVCFICTGYAQLVDTLTITGTATAKPPEGIYITSVEYVGKGVGVESETHSFIYPTTVSNTVLLNDKAWNDRPLTYKITVFNNTRYKYSYKGIETVTMDGQTNDNDRYKTDDYWEGFTVITKNNPNDSSATFKEGATVNPGETITFYATYQFGGGAPYDWNFSFLLNYNFGIHVDSMGDMALDRVLIRFGEILNTQSTYQDLITHIDDKFKDQEWQSNYIGNVFGAHNEDTKTIERLFGDSLSLTIDGVTKNITLLIKRENIDNNTSTGDRYGVTYPGQWQPTYYSGCEMTLYMTANDLDRVVEPGEYNDRDQADVYVAVFTCQSNANGTLFSDWYQIGDVYKGIAPIVSYDGGAGGTGSFVTDNWVSLAQTYQVTGHYTYNISANTNIKTIIPAVDTLARNEFNRLKNIAQRELNYINQNSDYFNEDVFAEPIANLQEVYNQANAMTVNNNTPRAHIVRILKQLENVVYPFLSYIGEY